MTPPETFVIELDAYEVANLRELFRACGYPYAACVPGNPFYAANTGDWLGQISQKLPEAEGYVCQTGEQIVENSRYRGYEAA